jgi:hypothetical protein
LIQNKKKKTEARDDKDAGFTKVTYKKQQQKKKKKETLLPQPLPPADRKLIFQLTSAPNVPPPTAAINALLLINKTIVEHPDIAHPPCPTAYITNSNALVILVADRYTAAAYNPYIGILQETLRSHNFPFAGASLVKGGAVLSFTGSLSTRLSKISSTKSNLSTRSFVSHDSLDGFQHPNRDKARQPHRW